MYGCSEASKISQAFSHSQELKDFVAEYLTGEMKTALSALHLRHDWGGMNDLCGWAIPYNCSDWSESPPWLTKEVMDICEKTLAFAFLGHFSYGGHVGVFGASVMRHILADADKQIANTFGHKYAVFSSHDTTVGALLVFLGVRWTEDAMMPRFTSSVSYEYWRDAENVIWCRFLYNGTPLELRLFENRTVVRLDEFRGVMNPHLNHCWEMHPLIGEVKLYL
jgi:hypothetical protein